MRDENTQCHYPASPTTSTSPRLSSPPSVTLRRTFQMSEFCLGKPFNSPFSRALHLVHDPPYTQTLGIHPTAQPCLDAMRFSCPPLQGESLCRESPPSSVFLPQGPAWGSKDKCFTKMYTTSGECCKACNLGEGVVQPCGVNQTVCEPCLDSEYLLPPRQESWAQGGFGDHEQAPGSSLCASPWESCVDALRPACSTKVPNSCANAPKRQRYFQDFPPILPAICPANPSPRSNNCPVPGPAGARHVRRSPSRAPSPGSPPAPPSKTCPCPQCCLPASHPYHCWFYLVKAAK